MATFLDEIQKRLKAMETMKAGEQIRREADSTIFTQESLPRNPTATRPFPERNLTNISLASSRENNSITKPTVNSGIFQANKIRETKALCDDYLNYSEIVKLYETFSQVPPRESACSREETIKEMNFYPSDGSGRNRFIFEDIPQEVLGFVDEFIRSGKDICQHFNDIDEIAFKPKVHHEKDVESDTDSGNGTIQTENGSVSSQTLHDEQKADGNNSTDVAAHHSPIRHVATLPKHDFTILEPQEASETGTSKSPQNQRSFLVLPPPPLEFCEEKVPCESKRMFVKGIHANRVDMKKGLHKSPAVLDKIPGTFLSQSCIDLSQISPKRRVTFADDVEISVQTQDSFSDSEEERGEKGTRREAIKSIFAKNETDSANKWKPFRVFNFLHKNQPRDKEEKAKEGKRFKKKSKKEKPKFCDSVCEDPFSDDDFSDFSDDNEELETTNHKKISEYKNSDDVFLTAFDDTRKNKSYCEGLNHMGKTVSAPKTIPHLIKLRRKEKNELKNGSFDEFNEKESSLSTQARNSTPEISVHRMKDKTHRNPLKNLKLKFRQLRGKSENDKKVRPVIKHPMDIEEVLKKDMEEALMNSDEECSDVNKSNKNVKLPVQKQIISSYYYPTPFSKKSVATKNVAPPGSNNAEVNSIYYSSPNSLTCEPSNQTSFETFLSPSKLKSKNLELNNKSENRSLFRFGVPSVKTPSQYMTTSDDIEDESQFSKKSEQTDTSNSSNTTNYKFLAFSSATEYKSSAHTYLKKEYLKKAIEIPLNKQLLKSEQTNEVVSRVGSSGGDELYLNYADIVSMRKLQKTDPISQDSNVERTSFIKSNPRYAQQSKPLNFKDKPRLDQTNPRGQSTIKSSANLLQNCSIEKMMKCYMSMQDLRCKKAISHCDNLSKHLRSFVSMERILPYREHISNKEHISAKVAHTLQNLRTICLSLVSIGKSMLIASTSSKTSFPEEVSKCIHLLADFSMESKHFALNCNKESDFRDLIIQFAFVVDLFELTIEECAEFSGNPNEANSQMKSLLEMANDLAKGLSTLLNTITNISV